MGRTFLPLMVLVATLLGACGGPNDPARRRLLASPLIERSTGAEDREALLIQARGPCRLVLIAEGLGGETLRRELVRRVLPAGRTVGLSWAIVVQKAPPEAKGTPSEEERVQGRTEAHEVIVAWRFEDEGDRLARHVVWTRPGLQRTFRHILPPPARPEPTPFGSAVELELVVVGDLRSKEVKFSPRGAFTNVEFVDDQPQDRLSPIRLILQVERP